MIDFYICYTAFKNYQWQKKSKNEWIGGGVACPEKDNRTINTTHTQKKNQTSVI